MRERYTNPHKGGKQPTGNLEVQKTHPSSLEEGLWTPSKEKSSAKT